MKKWLKLAAVAVALTMFVSAAAEAQGGGGGGGGAARGGGGGGGGQGRGGGGLTNRISAEGVSADSAYNLMFTGITLAAPKKATVMTLVTKLQADLKANPAPANAGRGGAAAGGTPPDSAAMAARAAITTKRNGFVTAFQAEVHKQLTPAEIAIFDATFPPPAARRGGGGG